MNASFPSTVSVLLTIITVFCANIQAVAGITWGATSKSLIVKSGTASTTYSFRNDGPEEVRILAVESSCNCVIASASEKNLPSGMTGEISAVFRGKNHLEKENKTIAVVSISGTNKEVQVLKLHVDIRPDITLDPPILSWAKDESPKAKVVFVRSLRADQSLTTIAQIKGGEPDFKISMNTSPDATGSNAWFSVTPVSTAKPKRNLIGVAVKTTAPDSQQIIMYSIVRPD